jgi:hypothetical protein
VFNHSVYKIWGALFAGLARIFADSPAGRQRIWKKIRVARSLLISIRDACLKKFAIGVANLNPGES